MSVADETKNGAGGEPADGAPARGRYFGPNPLPESAVGPRLLVFLKTEGVIEKLDLEEKFEGGGDWDFDDLCAVVACTLGEGYTLPGETERAVRVKARLGEQLVRKIEARLNRPLVDTSGSAVKLMPEVYEGFLILGLGHSNMPIDTSFTETEALAQALASYMEVDRVSVSERTFERAKRKVFNAYKKHQAKQKQRRLWAAESGNLSQCQMLRKAFGGLGVGCGSVQPLTPEIRALMAGVFMKAGIGAPRFRKDG